MNYQWMPAILLVVYLLYGFLRPFLSRQLQREIEEEDDDELPAAAGADPAIKPLELEAPPRDNPPPRDPVQ